MVNLLRKQINAKVCIGEKFIVFNNYLIRSCNIETYIKTLYYARKISKKKEKKLCEKEKKYQSNLNYSVSPSFLSIQFSLIKTEICIISVHILYICKCDLHIWKLNLRYINTYLFQFGKWFEIRDVHRIYLYTSHWLNFLPFFSLNYISQSIR